MVIKPTYRPSHAIVVAVAVGCSLSGCLGGAYTETVASSVRGVHGPTQATLGAPVPFRVLASYGGCDSFQEATATIDEQAHEIRIQALIRKQRWWGFMSGNCPAVAYNQETSVIVTPTQAGTYSVVAVGADRDPASSSFSVPYTARRTLVMSKP